jgi:hypothetical protein
LGAEGKVIRLVKELEGKTIPDVNDVDGKEWLETKD